MPDSQRQNCSSFRLLMTILSSDLNSNELWSQLCSLFSSRSLDHYDCILLQKWLLHSNPCLIEVVNGNDTTLHIQSLLVSSWSKLNVELRAHFIVHCCSLLWQLDPVGTQSLSSRLRGWSWSQFWSNTSLFQKWSYFCFVLNDNCC